MTNLPIEAIKSLRNGQAITDRLIWLENRLNWIGEFNRTELVERFDISKQQASADIAMYKKLAPNNFSFNVKSKLFIAAEAFTPIFNVSPQDWLKSNDLDQETLNSMRMHEIRGTPQHIDPLVFRVINVSYKRKIPVKVTFASLTSTDNEEKEYILSPHTIVATPIRWHVRAWNSTDHRFVDIPLSRISKAKLAPGTPWIHKDADIDWNTFVNIEIVPSDGLTPVQHASISKAFGMENDLLIIRERKCLAYYQLAAMQLLNAVREYHGHAINPNLRIKIRNYVELLPLVSDVSMSLNEIKIPDHTNDIAQLREIVKPIKSIPLTVTKTLPYFIQWVGSGYAKIAAAYASKIAIENGLASEFVSPLDFCSRALPKIALPVLLSFGGKGADALSVAKTMQSHDQVGLITASQDTPCSNLLMKNEKLIHTFSDYPERDARCVNFRSIMTLAVLVERFCSEHLDIALPQLTPSFWDRLDDSESVANHIVSEIQKIRGWRHKQVVILGSGHTGQMQYAWSSLLAEAGIALPVWCDLKDFTHGEHRYSSLSLDQIFIVLKTPENEVLANIFQSNFSQLFPVISISLMGNYREQFWQNLFMSFFVTEGLSLLVGYNGMRPPKNEVVHAWRNWGQLP